MILVTSPNKPFKFNTKGLPRRSIMETEYHDEIEALYKEVEDSARSDVPPPTTWDPASTLAYVRAVVESTLQKTIPDDADIFRNGGDRCRILFSSRDSSLEAEARCTVCKPLGSGTPSWEPCAV